MARTGGRSPVEMKHPDRMDPYSYNRYKVKVTLLDIHNNPVEVITVPPKHSAGVNVRWVSMCVARIIQLYIEAEIRSVLA